MASIPSPTTPICKAADAEVNSNTDQRKIIATINGYHLITHWGK
jgi:hypothetical protein